MRHPLYLSVLFGLIFPVPGGAQQPVRQAGAPTEAAAVLPLTTASADARAHFLTGLRRQDVAAPSADARAHFDRAIAADPTFAMAHLHRAMTSSSFAEYRAHLGHAVQHAGRASRAEQLFIEVDRRQFDGDVAGAVDVARQLVEAAPGNPRALLHLASAQASAGQVTDARASMLRAIEAAPRFAPAHVQLGNSFLQVEPRDAQQGIAHIRHAVDIEPDEPYTHDFLGDAYRAANDLPAARAAYTRMTELAPRLAIAYQQRAHVHAFLGEYRAARADYDRAIELADPEDRSSYRVYRALVGVHSGEIATAEAELDNAVASVDSTVPGATEARIFALQTKLAIALHHRHVDVAERTQRQLRALRHEMAGVGNATVRQQQLATVAWEESMLASARGDYDAARARAREYMLLRAGENNPRKEENAHWLLGYADVLQGRFTSAIQHLTQADASNPYVSYFHGLALEGAGRARQAKEMYARAAGNNFNGVATALIKRDAMRKAK